MMAKQVADYDSPWKEMLERYFKEFVAFFFPKAYQQIDWSKGYTFLDKEFQKVVRDAELGRRLVDKLVRVHKLDGKKSWVLVHIEVQGRYDMVFTKRMFVYNYRIYDRYERSVGTFAILADEDTNWRPSGYGYELWDCEMNFKFPIVKLLDYEARLDELERETNPFAIIVFAHLKTLATKKNDYSRLEWKIRIAKMLYQRGYSREDILELFRFIDWVMVLPDELEQQFNDEVETYEKANNMQYVTYIERTSLEKGRQQGIQQGLQQGLLLNSRNAIMEILKARFVDIPSLLELAINRIDDLSSLKDLLRKAITIPSLDEFQALPELQTYDATQR